MITRNILILLSIPALGAIGCDNENDNEILESIDKGVEALEEADVRGAVKLTTSDFLGFPGRIDRRSLTWRLKNFFDVSGGVQVHAPIPDIEWDGDAAFVEGPFIMTRAGVTLSDLNELDDDPEAWVEAAQVDFEIHRAELRMVKSDDRWLVQTIRIF